MIGNTQILPIIVILISIIVLGVVCCVTYKIATAHYMRQKQFFVNTILPLLLFSITNMAITMCHQVDVMMTKYIGVKEREFVENGGIREAMSRARLQYRNEHPTT